MEKLNLLLISSIAIFLFSCGQGKMYKEKAMPINESYMAEEEAVPITRQDADIPKPDFNTEEYSKIVENNFKDAKQNPLSTFSIDVDNASYSNIRRFLEQNTMPPGGAVRIEEMINYFSYDYPDPQGEHPFSVYSEVSQCPWNTKHQLVHIGIQGKKLNYKDLKPSNLVFLIDASGSMSDNNKLPLLKKALKLLLDQLSEKDHVAIVAYAGSAGLILPSTPATKKEKILKAIDKLEAGGSTAGGEGIKLAYKVAEENYIPDGNNRVILATDGDFNVGVSSTDQLIKLVRNHADKNIFLTILGFGMGNYKDSRMEDISNSGNGNYFYIDNMLEAQKVFVKEMRANMFTIAKDVKIQVEFNPAKIKAYRLIGYENRVMQNEDFNNDKKDAGELGAGHTVTALYELIPAGSDEKIPQNDSLKYQQTNIKTGAANSNELMFVKIRYKPVKADKSILISFPIKDEVKELSQSSNNFRFSAAVAEFGLLLRHSKFKGNANFKQVKELAQNAKGTDEMGYRNDFIRLVNLAELMYKPEKDEENK